MTDTIGIVGGTDALPEQWLRESGLRVVRLEETGLQVQGRGAPLPGAVIVDVRRQRELLGIASNLKRIDPSIGIAIVCSTLDPELMLEAMRAGVTECIAEPLTQESLQASVNRLVHQAAPAEGRAFAIVGAKGGVGTTTIAVNLARTLAQAGEVLLIDLSSGDAGTFLGAEPRFTVHDALENTHRLDDAFFRSLVVKTSPKLDLLATDPCSVAAAGPADVRNVRALVEFAVRSYQYVVLDVARTGAAVLDALDAAAGIFVVVNQELHTVRQAQALMTHLRQRYAGDRIAALVNRADRQAEITEEDVRKALNVRIRHAFPSEYRHAIAALNKGEPIAASRKGRLASAFHAFARGLVGPGSVAADEKAPAPALTPSRLFGWLSPDRSTAQ